MVRIGVDVGGTTVKLGAVENGRDIVYRDTRPTPHDPEALSRLVAGMVSSARAVYPGAPFALSMAGGFGEDGLFSANMLGFENVPLRRLMESAAGERVRIENDGVCAMMAEYAAGALKGCDPAVMVTLGTGVGGGVVWGGRPYKGRGGIHAELGHMITHAGGRPCSCGQIGCWERYASATALSELAGGLSPREAVDAVRAGGLKDVWREYTNEIAQGLISLCSLFAPQAIAIGGGLSNAGDILLDGIREALARDRGYNLYYRAVRIVPAAFRNDAGIVGAAALAEA